MIINFSREDLADFNGFASKFFRVSEEAVKDLDQITFIVTQVQGGFIDPEHRDRMKVVFDKSLNDYTKEKDIPAEMEADKKKMAGHCKRCAKDLGLCGFCDVWDAYVIKLKNAFKKGGA